MIKNGNVESVFHSTKSKEEFTDIANLLIEIPEDVDCNYKYDGENFTPPEVEE